MSFKIFLTLALATLVLAEETIPEVPTAEAILETSSNVKLAIAEGKNFLLTCKNKGTFSREPTTMHQWLGDTAFYHDGKLLGEYKRSNGASMMAYHTASFPEGFNVWPTTDVQSEMELRSNYSVVIIPKGKATVSGVFKCSVTLHHQLMSMDPHEHGPEMRFFSNEVKV